MELSCDPTIPLLSTLLKDLPTSYRGTQMLVSTSTFFTIAYDTSLGIHEQVNELRKWDKHPQMSFIPP